MNHPVLSRRSIPRGRKDPESRGYIRLHAMHSPITEQGLIRRTDSIEKYI